jgi:hypothetical protein
VTGYNLLNGVMLSADFDGGAANAVIADGTGHVRLVVSPSGETLYSANYDARGNVLDESGSIAGHWVFQYMGAFGCLWVQSGPRYHTSDRNGLEPKLPTPVPEPAPMHGFTNYQQGPVEKAVTETLTGLAVGARISVAAWALGVPQGGSRFG